MKFILLFILSVCLLSCNYLSKQQTICNDITSKNRIIEKERTVCDGVSLYISSGNGGICPLIK